MRECEECEGSGDCANDPDCYDFAGMDGDEDAEPCDGCQGSMSCWLCQGSGEIEDDE